MKIVFFTGAGISAESGVKTKYFVNKEIPHRFLKEDAGIVCYEENATTGIPKVIDDLKVLDFSI